MSVLDDPRHERFALLVANGMPYDHAYTGAGYKPSRAHASRLATNGNVKARVLELQTKIGDKVMVDKAKVMSKLAGIAFDDAEERRDQIRCLELLGKELGMFTGKEPPPGDERKMSTPELIEALKKLQ